MKALRFILILSIACVCFIAIDNVYAYSLDIKVTSGSCTKTQVGFYDPHNGLYYAQVNCNANSKFYVYYVMDSTYEWYKCPSSDCTYVSTVQYYSNDSSSKNLSISGSMTHATILNNYSYHPPTSGRGYWYPDAYPVRFKATEYYYGPYPNASTSPLINVKESGSYFFTIQTSVLPGNQAPTIQSSYETAKTDQKLDEVQDSIDKVDDTLKDDDISGAQDNAGGFFNNFDVEDNGGISAVITAPLVFVRKATDSCSPLTLKAFDKDIELPCGTTLFWDKPEVVSFRAVWNTILGGAILFMLLRKVFKVIENVKDPQSDKVEVMKL